MPIAGELLRDGILANLLNFQFNFFVTLILNGLFWIRLKFFAQGLAYELGLHYWLQLETIFEQIGLTLRLLVLLL